MNGTCVRMEVPVRKMAKTLTVSAEKVFLGNSVRSVSIYLNKILILNFA